MDREVQGGAVLTGTARIGLKALFPTQGPHAANPHRCQDYIWLSPKTENTLSFDSEDKFLLGSNKKLQFFSFQRIFVFDVAITRMFKKK